MRIGLDGDRASNGKWAGHEDGVLRALLHFGDTTYWRRYGRHCWARSKTLKGGCYDPRACPLQRPLCPSYQKQERCPLLGCCLIS